MRRLFGKLSRIHVFTRGMGKGGGMYASSSHHCAFLAYFTSAPIFEVFAFPSRKDWLSPVVRLVPARVHAMSLFKYTDLFSSICQGMRKPCCLFRPCPRGQSLDGHLCPGATGLWRRHGRRQADLTGLITLQIRHDTLSTRNESKGTVHTWNTYSTSDIDHRASHSFRRDIRLAQRGRRLVLDVSAPL